MSRNVRLDLVHEAIRAGYHGQIEWKAACLVRFLDDPEMMCFTEKGLKQSLWDFVLKGGRLQARRETDQDWLREHPEDPWWYFAIITVPEFNHGLFVKVKLLWEDGDDEDDAFVQIVSIHEEKPL